MSTLKVNTLEEATAGGATFFTAKAWANVNQIGTSTLRNDGGVSSLNDLGTGYFRLNFSNTAPTSHWSMTATGNGYGPSDPGGQTAVLRSNTGNFWQSPLFSTTSVEIETGFNSSVNSDFGYIGVQVVY